MAVINSRKQSKRCLQTATDVLNDLACEFHPNIVNGDRSYISAYNAAIRLRDDISRMLSQGYGEEWGQGCSNAPSSKDVVGENYTSEGEVKMDAEKVNYGDVICNSSKEKTNYGDGVGRVEYGSFEGWIDSRKAIWTMPGEPDKVFIEKENGVVAAVPLKLFYEIICKGI